MKFAEFKLLNISILLGLFLPHNHFILQIIHSLLPLILYLGYGRRVRLETSNKQNIVFIIVILLSFSLNVLTGNCIAFKDIGRLCSFVILFGLFPFIRTVRFSNKILYLSLLLIFLSQIAYVLDISMLVNFFDRFYPYTGEARVFSSEFLLQASGDINSIADRRYGGIYHNPNQVARYITLLLSVFLLENRRNSIKTIAPYLVITFTSIVLSGSRTGFAVGCIFTTMYFIYLKKESLKAKGAFYLILFFCLMFYAIHLIYGDSELRVFQLSSGIDRSLSVKVGWFFDFFNQLDSPLFFLIGHFSTSNLYDIYRVSLLDSEWGELFYSFGLVGAASLLFFYYKLFSSGNKNVKFYLMILLWCISSTVIFSFRMSLLFVLFLSKYYSECQLAEGKK